MLRVSFKNKSDTSLSGCFWPHSGGKAVVICHGFTGRFDSPNKRELAEALSCDYAVLGFDFAGCGSSGGRFEDTTISSEIGDLESALVWLGEQGYAEFGLAGHSLGGVIALCEAAENKNVGAVCTVSAPFFHERYPDAFMSADQMAVWKRDGFISYSGPQFTFDLKYGFKEDQSRHLMSVVLPGVRQPLLVVHGESDGIVPIEEASEFLKLKKDSELLVIPSGDHGLLPQAKIVSERMREFFGRNLRTLTS